MQTKMLYWVTGDGTITQVEGQIAAATAAGDPVFARPFSDNTLIGRNLFDFIEGMEVRHIYTVFHERVLRTAQEIAFNYRCDSPWIRRDMRLRLRPDRDLVRYESVVLKETPRPVPIPATSPDPEILIAMCSMCKKYRNGPAGSPWTELDLIFNEPGLPERFDFTHTICPPCVELFLAEAPRCS